MLANEGMWDAHGGGGPWAAMDLLIVEKLEFK